MQKKKQGISLIVLVITIIVMIILAAAIIISLQNNGIINRASTAVKAYNEDEVSHMASLAWSEAYLNPAITTDEEYAAAVNTVLTNQGVDLSKYLITVTTSGVTVKDKSTIWTQDGVNITKGNVTLEAGDLIQYNAGVQGYEGAWKVLGAEDGNLLIMATEDVDTLNLYGLEGNGTNINYGLKNGIARLNQICEAYGSGAGAVGARSIEDDDVIKLTQYDKTTYNVNEVNQYGNVVTYSWSTEEEGRIDYTSTNGASGTGAPHSNGFTYVDFNTMQETTVLVGNTIPPITSTYYAVGLGGSTASKVKEMILGDFIPAVAYYSSKYWLASPVINADSGIAIFGLRMVAGGYGGIQIASLFISTGAEYNGVGSALGVRAVVKLSPDITIGQKDNTLGWSYTI